MKDSAINLTSEYFTIPGYRVEELIGEGSSSRVYRAHSDKKLYVIKISKDVALSPEQKIRQRREAILLARLNHPNITKVIESGEVNGRTYLVLEYVGGGSLSDRIRVNGSLSLEELASTALGLARALREIEALNIVHQDLKPDNVLISAEGEPKLIDFNLSTRHAGESTSVIGTLAYGSPEQLGLLSRPTDHRSDLYSLGCVLYECATGYRPFSSPDPSELLRCHMNEVPPLITQSNKQVGPAFAQIVAKLLAKDPDNRYQSARGLINDLENLNVIDSRVRRGESIDLDEDNPLSSDRGNFVGRKVELDRVAQAVMKGLKVEGSIVLVEGESGLGKSRLVRESLKNYEIKNTPIIYAKVLNQESSPLACIREGLNSWLHRTKKLSNVDHKFLFDRFRKAAGASAPIIGRLFPEWASIFGRDDETRRVFSKQEQEKHIAVLADFICSLALEFHGLIFFLENLQWVDRGSREVFARIVSNIELTPLVVIGTIRGRGIDDEGGANSGNNDFFMSHCKERLVLQPLSDQESHEFIAPLIGGRDLTPTLMQKLLRAANGNPLALYEYMNAILDQGILRPSESMWVAAGDSIDDVVLTTDVVQLMINRVKSLGRNSYNLLCIAAVAGSEFTWENIRLISDEKESEVQRSISEALMSNLVERTEEGFRFTHDSVQKELIQELEPSYVQDLHWKFALSIIERVDLDDFYGLAHHCIEGGSGRHPHVSFSACYRAGIDSLSACSNEQAFYFLNEAQQLSSRLNLNAEETFNTAFAISRASLMTGKYLLALEYAGKLRGNSPQDHEHSIELRMIASEAHASMGNLKASWQELCGALGQLGASPPKSKFFNIISFIILLGVTMLIVATGWRKGKATAKERKRRRQISRVHTPRGLQVAYFYHPVYFANLIVRERLNVHFLGECPEYAKASVVFSFLPAILGWRGLTNRIATQAIEVAKRLEDKETLAYCEAYACIGIDFAGGSINDHLRLFENEAIRAKTVAQFCGQWEIVTSIGSCGSSYFHRGKDIANVNHVLQYHSTTHRGDDNGITIAVDTSYYVSLCLLGRDEEAKNIFKRLKERVHKDDVYGQTWIWGGEILRLLDKEVFGNEIEEAIKQYSSYGFIEYHTRIFLAAIALTRQQQYRNTDNKVLKKKYAKQFKRSYLFAFLMCRSPVHKVLIYAASAGFAADQGKVSLALRRLRKAERFAQMSGSSYGFWLIARERARLAQRGLWRKEWHHYAETARQIAVDEGWHQRKLQITRDFGLSEAPSTKPGNSGRDLSPSSSSYNLNASSLRSQRIISSLLQVAQASTTVTDPKIQATRALKALVKVLNAERGFLFLNKKTGSGFELAASCNSRGQDLTEVESYSSTLVHQVFSQKEPIVHTGSDKEELTANSSIIMNNLKSIIAAPISYQDEFFGIVYLDSSFATGIFTRDDLDVLEAITNHIAVALVMGRAAIEEASRQVLEKEIAVTKNVQAMLLPKVFDYSCDYFQLASTFIAATQASGDWWWWEHDEKRSCLRLLVGDVSGHGAGSAMVTAIAASALDAVRRLSPQQSLLDTLGFLNETLYNFCGETHFMTMCAVEINLDNNKIDAYFAGTPPLLLVSPDKSIVRIRDGGLPLGIERKANIGHESKEFVPGSRLYLYTDGCYEVANMNGKMLGVNGLMRLIQSKDGVSCRSELDSITQEIRNYQGKKELQDDLTMVVVHI